MVEVLDRNVGDYIGSQMKLQREAMGRTIAELADDTCIRSVYLHAIEEGISTELPEQAFAVGFVRNYANSLGMDADQVVHSFREYFNMPDQAQFDCPDVMPVKRNLLPAWMKALFGVTAIVVSMTYMAQAQSENNQPTILGITLSSR